MGVWDIVIMAVAIAVITVFATVVFECIGDIVLKLKEKLKAKSKK